MIHDFNCILGIVSINKCTKIVNQANQIMKIALVHDYLVQNGGAERVLKCLTEIWPDAPIYVIVYDKKRCLGFEDKKIKTSFLQKIPGAKKYHRLFPFLMMNAIEEFNFNEYDIVLSDSSSFAKNIITSPRTLHLCYCHTPMRYAWDDCQYYTQEFGFPSWLKKIVPFLMNYMRVWDHSSTNGVDFFIANSKFVRGRIKKYYQRNSIVINPPVQIDNFYLTPKEKLKDYFLITGRMMKYKKMDLVIEVFNEIKMPLKIIGQGVEYKNLKKIAGPTIEFLGKVSEKKLRRTYSEAQAFIFPQEEDFGIVAIEALASGRPVIAYKAGDIVEHIEENKTGIFFEKQNKESLKKAIKRFRETDFDSKYIRKTVLAFSENSFKVKIEKEVLKNYKKFKETVI
jgi:glycosyltransferase involved in cell wall biosynthesis